MTHRVIFTRHNGDEPTSRIDSIDLDRVSQTEWTPADESKGRKRDTLILHYNADDFVALYGIEARMVQSEILNSGKVLYTLEES